MEARFIDGARFKRIVDALKDAVNEVNFECDDEGIKVQAMDDSHVGLVALTLHSSYFDKYVCEESMTVGANVETLQKLIRSTPNGESLTLRKNLEDDLLMLTSDEDNESGCLRNAAMKLIVIDQERLQVPEQNYEGEVEIPTRLFSTLIKDMSTIADTVKIRLSAKSINFEAEGDVGKVEQSYHRGTGQFKELRWNYSKSETGPTTSVLQEFAIRYLVYYAKACPLSDTCFISMSRQSPIRIKFPLDAEEQSFLAFYLAPKLDEQ